MKKKMMLILSAVMLCNAAPVTILAQETAAIQESKNGAGVSIFTKPNQIPSGIRKAPAEDIIISEGEAGLLKKGDVLYLQVESLRFENSAAFEVVAGDGKVKKVEAQDDILKIEIGKATTKEPFEIKISQLELFLDGALPNGVYPLNLITKRTGEFKNNFLGDVYDENDGPEGFDIESITLLPNYVEIRRDISYVDGTQPSMQVAVDMAGQMITTAGKQTPLESPAYISEKGNVMLPVRAVADAIYYGTANVSYDPQSQTTTVFMGSRIISVTPGERTMTINGTAVPLKTPAEIRDGRLFLELWDMGIAFGVPEKRISWDEETQTAAFYGEVKASN